MRMSLAVGSLVSLVLLAGCSKPAAVTATNAIDKATVDSLVAIIAAFDHDWEPQRAAEGISDAAALERTLAPFARDSDFAMVIDAAYYPSFQAWAEHEAISLPQARREEREGHHENLALRAVRLGMDGAAVTQIYRYTFVEASGRRGMQVSAATFVFRRGAGRWEIVQYHGSHGKPAFSVKTDGAK